ncbi:hypothetical protein EI94DRAFT_1747802 [Lactarius quietus]|nr:hypothetical protein EI94DRAFT_1747802 [Lactarius quietus]
MLFNSIISFVAAIALTTSVAVSRIVHSKPNPLHNPSQSVGVRGPQVKARDVVPSCSTGTSTCCGSTVKFGALTPQQQTELHSLDSNVNENLNVGLYCVAAGAHGWYSAIISRSAAMPSRTWLTFKALPPTVLALRLPSQSQ